MSDTNDMRRDFEDMARGPIIDLARDKDGYKTEYARFAWAFWQAATERATALERERCAKVLDALMTSRRRMNSSQKPDCEYVAAVRQGGAT